MTVFPSVRPNAATRELLKGLSYPFGQTLYNVLKNHPLYVRFYFLWTVLKTAVGQRTKSGVSPLLSLGLKNDNCEKVARFHKGEKQISLVTWCHMICFEP